MSPDGHPHIVPVTFVVDGGAVWWVVDTKPKRTRELARLSNIRANPRVAMLGDHYGEDWASLWWCRVDGTARIVEEGSELERAIELLAARYEPYRTARPPGPAVRVQIERVTGWAGGSL